jgi:hypothetical protein
MVEDLRAAFKELVTESDWMDAATQVSSGFYVELQFLDHQGEYV